MEPIRVVWGTGKGSTAMASYDAALAAAGVENYNLVCVSSVIPPGATVEAVGEAPDLGRVGDRVTVVEATATATGRVSAALAWAESPDGGLFYEAAGPDDPGAVRGTATEGLAAGRDLRDWSFDEPSIRSVSATPGEAAYASAVVLAVYGSADPLL